LSKSSNTVTPLSHPEAQAVFVQMAKMLGRESDRGIVLIGAVHIDECLTKLLGSVFRPDLSKTEQRRLLKYPGVLSTFAARIDAAYAFRLIPRDVRDALDALRQLRNELAHKPAEFTLVGNEARYFKIYALGPNLTAGTRAVAFKTMFDSKLNAAKSAARKLHQEQPDIFPEQITEAELVRRLTSDKEYEKQLEKQLPHWELLIGISLLASMIIYHRDKAVSALGGAKLVGDLKAPKQKGKPRRGPT
jgi:hypothetical protein